MLPQITQRYSTPLPKARPHGARPTPGIPLDTFTPSEPLIGLPDLNKYPDWKPGGRGLARNEPSTPIPVNDKTICGGPDSPCFYRGRVMTIREAKRLAGES